MTMQHNIAIAQTLLDDIAAGRDPVEIAAPFAEDLSFEVQGDEGVMPWVGRKVGRQAIVGC